MHRHEFNGIIDGIVYAALVGLGFAMTENVLYYGRGAAEEGVVGAVVTFVVRGVMSPFAHPLFTAMTGIGLGSPRRRGSRTLRVAAPLVGLGAAMVLHSLWNTAAGAGLFLGAYFLIMVPVFLALRLLVALGCGARARVIARQLPRPAPEQEVAGARVAAERRRRRARGGRARGGRTAKRAMGDLQQVAAELAFHREQGAATAWRWRASRRCWPADGAAAQRARGARRLAAPFSPRRRDREVAEVEGGPLARDHLAIASPIAAECLKPWPEQGEATITCSELGRRVDDEAASWVTV